MKKRLKHPSCEEKLRELSLFNLEKRRLKDHFMNVYKYPKEERKEDGVKIFSLIPRDTRGKGNKLITGTSTTRKTPLLCG